jgi:hypothetical protein
VKAAPLCDGPSASAFGFEWLADAVAPLSAYGARAFAGLRPFARGKESAALARARTIAEIAATGETALDAARACLRDVPDVAGPIARAAMGGILEDADFLELLRFAEAAERLDGLLSEVPAIAPITGGAIRKTRAALELGRTGTAFYLSDAYAADLATARSNLQQKQAGFDQERERWLERVERELGRDDLTGDEFVILRDDLGGPLPAGVRVLREAPTYWLCAPEFEPATLAALAARDAAFDAVAAAEERVRENISAVVAGLAAELDVTAAALGEVDVLVAAACFTLRHDCRAADVVAEPVLAFEGGRFLPLAAELAAEGREFVPIDVELHDVAVLTGPNMGGKSICLRTCGFIALCAAYGLPVPAAQARVGLFDEIAWLGIGSDERRLGGLLSSFAQEVVRVRDVLARSPKRLLVLIDEFARTTTPPEGKALLVALLERLRDRDARGMAATHLSGIAAAAGVRHFAVRGLRGIAAAPPAADLHAALAALADSMDYSIAEVRDDGAGSADALALAAWLGLDSDLVAGAYRHLADS